jgi:hypothetical protein
MANPPRKNAGKTRGRPFQRGNPGRPKGAQNRTTRLIEALLEGEAEAIGRKCIERAKEGDPVALRLAMERIAPVGRGRSVHFTMPALETAADLPKALGAVLTAASNGEITPEEAVSVAQGSRPGGEASKPSRSRNGSPRSKSERRSTDEQP